MRVEPVRRSAFRYRLRGLAQGRPADVRLTYNDRTVACTAVQRNCRKAVGAYSKTVGYEYVPWIEIDGHHSSQAEENLTEFLCRK